MHDTTAMYRKIGDYGLIGSSQTAALVGLDGSIDWLCLPSLDSPSVFAAVLDRDRGGRFAVTPEGDWDSTAAYLPGTNVLVTRFRTRSGRLRLTDFMPLPPADVPGDECERQELFRLVECTEGEVAIRVDFAPRFDYGRAVPTMDAYPKGVVARAGGSVLALVADRDGLRVAGDRAEASWRLRAGEQVWLRLVYGDGAEPGLTPLEGDAALEETRRRWHDWLAQNETGQDLDFGPFRGMIERSSLVLKLLQFAPTGAVAAAPTTSLPEEIGGGRNWDYRFAWLRDSAFTVEALFNMGHLAEMEAYFRWLEQCVCGEGRELQIVYGLRGETVLDEEELPHLEGYKGSRPVRIGNGAYRQRQLDIYGEVMDAALRLSNYVGKIDFGLWPFLRDVCEAAAAGRREPDSGIWEVRGGPHHFVYSKVMCWVALDRGITIARRYGFPADLDRWTAVRDEIRREVLARGWDERQGSFVQHYDTGALDASNLLLSFYGFLPYDHPKMVSTVAAIRRELAEDGFVYRYRTEDGLSGGEGTFLLCTFWLVDNLIGQGRLDEAQILLLRLEGTANHLGLFAEEYDPGWREPLGNFPQAFTHIGYVNSVFALCRARRERERTSSRKPVAATLRQKLLLTRRYVLNEGEPLGHAPAERVAADLKHLMNVLRGAFFRTAQGRVAYEEMAASKVYREYEERSRDLQRFDPARLGSREERLAFWINLFNVLVVHGVIALEIRDSVREVPRFFRRIAYRIGAMEFTADDIEHGVLRGNRRFPHSLLRPFDAEDPRYGQVVEPLDPRIHFALVCASASCPPIEIYRAETLDEDLAVSGKTFLSSGGVRIDRERGAVWLPQVFRWYGEDFGATEADRLRFVAPYLYDPEDRDYLAAHAGRLRAEYHPYDWRLNRT
ncbi:MAG: glycoside hydrolase family 15 protein [Deferrisomatales bacterium]|nr:glycoside hydrolase family 15 protein [Deferrisomatales bacterium]